jgi:hypothetical protein
VLVLVLSKAVLVLSEAVLEFRRTRTRTRNLSAAHPAGECLFLIPPELREDAVVLESRRVLGNLL